MNIKQSVGNLWQWRKSTVWIWGEAAGLTLITLFFCHYFNPSNPLFVKAMFPWPWLASVIIVFQYGFGPALLTAGIITVGAFFQKEMGMLSILDFQAYVLSGLTLIMICALSSSSWARRVIHAEVLEAYNDERLKSLSRSYYMLRISTDYLEQNIITKPMTLRLALKELLKLNVQQGGSLSWEAGEGFLHIIAQLCSVNIAGIYCYEGKKINLEPFVELGSMGMLDKKDPVIKKCLEIEQLCYVGVNQIEKTTDCNYLLAIPLIGDKNNPLGILVIKDIPFWNLREETVRTLTILSFYFAKELVTDPEVGVFLQAYPSCTVDFARQLIRLIDLKKEMNIDSALVAIVIPKTLTPHNVIYNLENQSRFLDAYWSMEQGDNDVLITLMPFTAAAGISGYKKRISNYLQLDLGLDMEREAIKTRAIQLYSAHPLALMDYFLNYIKEEHIAQPA